MFGTTLRLIALGAIGLSVCGCATTSNVATNAWMPIGMPAAAPAGFDRFCEIHAGECTPLGTAPELMQAGQQPAGRSDDDGVAAIEVAEASEPAAAEAPVRTPAPVPANGFIRIASSEAPVAQPLPALALLTGRAEPPPAQTRMPPATPRPVAKSEVWERVKTVNADINGRIRAATDREIYGVEERWALPLSEGHTTLGDCEDYALEKRRALLALGVPETAMFFAVGVHKRFGRHLVLVVSTDEGDYVLDSMTPWILKWHEASYDWRTRQLTARSRAWVEARPAAQPTFAEAALDSPPG